jgi:transposase
MRGINLIAAVAILAEIGDLSRFQNPRELMGYLGLVPSESSTGDKVKRGGITKAGNGRGHVANTGRTDDVWHIFGYSWLDHPMRTPDEGSFGR